MSYLVERQVSDSAPIKPQLPQAEIAPQAAGYRCPDYLLIQALPNKRRSGFFENEESLTLKIFQSLQPVICCCRVLPVLESRQIKQNMVQVGPE